MPSVRRGSGEVRSPILKYRCSSLIALPFDVGYKYGSCTSTGMEGA